MNSTSNKADIMLAWAQILLSFCFVFGIFALVFFLLLSKNATPPAILTIVGSVIASLITVLTLQQNYFFARQRPPTLPDLPDPGVTPNAPIAPLKPAPAPNADPAAAINPVGSDTRGP